MTAPSGRVAASCTDRALAPASITSMIGVAQAKTAWNTTAMTTNRPMVPGTGRFRKALTRAPQVTTPGASRCTSASTPRTQS